MGSRVIPAQVALAALVACTPRGEGPPREALEPSALESGPQPAAQPRRAAPGWSALAPGVHHACALERGRVLCWGINRAGILGAGPGLPDPVTGPRAVAGLERAGSIVQIDADYDFTCALASDGAVYCWGDNDAGQLGLGDLVRRDRPTRVPGVSASSIHVGFEHACAVSTDRRQGWCWGTGDFGDGQRRSRQLQPVAISELAGVDQLANPGGHACLLRDGAVLCWGGNSGGQIGNGEGGCEYDEPLCEHCACLPPHTCRRVDRPTSPAGLPEVVEIAASGAYTYARERGGAVWQWGQVGETMSFDERPNYRPRRVEGLPPVVEITAGASHACARTERGEVYCWGNDSFGQLGFENPDRFGGDHPTPVRVEGLPPARQVASGFYFTCALAGEGDRLDAWCWGDNGTGQLGDGTTERRSTPGRVMAP